MPSTPAIWLEEVVIVGEVAYTRSRGALSATPRAGGEATGDDSRTPQVALNYFIDFTCATN
jgi:hypothetical protein